MVHASPEPADDNAPEPDPPAAKPPPLVFPGWLSGACVSDAGEALHRRPYDGREDDDG